jgi:uncharacterized phosphosugar-binding protein
MSGKKYMEEILGRIERIRNDQWDSIRSASEMIADVIEKGGFIHAFGSGHTHILVEEFWCRAGGLAPINPILDPDQMPYTGPFKGSALEKLVGFGKILFDTHHAEPGDLIIILSNSGRNPTPIEIARAAKERGLTVVAITSMDYSTQVPSRDPSGKKLYEIADLVIDNAGPLGDALIDLEGSKIKAGPATTVLNALILNTIVCEVASILLDRGISPPIFVSANLDVPMDHNEVLFEKYGSKIRLFDRYPGW